MESYSTSITKILLHPLGNLPKTLLAKRSRCAESLGDGARFIHFVGQVYRVVLAVARPLCIYFMFCFAVVYYPLVALCPAASAGLATPARAAVAGNVAAPLSRLRRLIWVTVGPFVLE